MLFSKQMAVIIAPTVCLSLEAFHFQIQALSYFDIKQGRAVNECPAWCDDGNILNLKASFCSLPIARIGYKSNYSIPTSFLWIPIQQRRPPPTPQLDFLCCKFNIKMRNSCSVPKWFKESDIEWISSSNLPRVVPLGRPSSFLWIKRRTWWTQNRTEEEFN